MTWTLHFWLRSRCSVEHKQLQLERDDVDAERRGWERARNHLDDLQWWCHVQSGRLADLTYDQKRLALFALNVETTVWSKDHGPRFTTRMQIDLDQALSDPHLAADGDLFEAHVGASIRHGCARRGGRRAGRL